MDVGGAFGETDKEFFWRNPIFTIFPDGVEVRRKTGS
jgi:hypothetical protein